MFLSRKRKKTKKKKENTSLLKTCSFVHSTEPTVWLQLPGNSSAVPSRDPPRTTGPPSAWNPHLSRPRQTCSCSTSASSLPPTTCRTQRGGHTHSEDWTNFFTNSTNQERHYTQAQTLWDLSHLTGNHTVGLLLSNLVISLLKNSNE